MSSSSSSSSSSCSTDCTKIINKCAALTLKGKRCSNKGIYNSYCYIHNVIYNQKCGKDEVKEDKVEEPESNTEKCGFIGCKNISKINHKACEQHNNLLLKIEKPENCPICLDSIEDLEFPLSCGHWIHRSCQLKFKNTCSVCRQKILLSNEESENMKIKSPKEREKKDRIYLINVIQILENIRYYDKLESNLSVFSLLTNVQSGYEAYIKYLYSVSVNFYNDVKPFVNYLLNICKIKIQIENVNVNKFILKFISKKSKM